MTKNIKKITVQVPASIANLGPGFDIFAIAISDLYDSVTIEKTNNNRIELKVSGIKADSISEELEENTAGVVAEILSREFSLNDGFRIHLKKGIPHSLGLGSSGASAAGTAYALNQLYKLNLSEIDLISFASQGEAAISGSVHIDNVSASIFGGFILVQSYNPIIVHKIQPPQNLKMCVVIPKVPVHEKKTAFARKILPREVILEQLVHNVGHASSFIYGMTTGKIDIMKDSMSDVIVEEFRSKLIPGYEIVKEYAKKLNTNVAICGSGPSIVSFFDREKEAYTVLNALKEGFRNAGIQSSGFITRPDIGIRIVHL
ncbi:MAG: homoserine kinase [Candidatus Bathyarchaeota archaeon]|nr:homoserine kinase [Candidatus Bathyarchaeota archaeon]